jgi:hypothetical protein
MEVSELIPNIFSELASLTVAILAFAITAFPPGCHSADQGRTRLRGAERTRDDRGQARALAGDPDKTCFDGTIPMAQLG